MGKNLLSETAATESAVVFTQLLLALSAEYGKKGKTAEADRDIVLRFAYPLFLRALRKVNTMSSRGQALQVLQVLQVLEVFVAQVRVMPGSPSEDSVSAMVQGLAYRILTLMLSSACRLYSLRALMSPFSSLSCPCRIQLRQQSDMRIARMWTSPYT